MIFETKEVYCIIEVLRMLNLRKDKYSRMFKDIGVSHTTIQSVLKDLINNKFIVKYDIGHQNVDYNITTKGKKLLALLNNLNSLVKN